MTITQLREAIAAALEPLPANVNPYASLNPNTPGIQVLPPGAEYDQTFGGVGSGLDKWTVLIQAFVSYTENAGTQIVLDELTDPTGVKAHLEADPTLGGICAGFRVVSQTPGQLFVPPAGSPMLVVEFTAELFA